MIDLNASLTIWVLKMIIEFSPYLLLSFSKIRSSRFQNINTFVLVLVKQVGLLWARSLSTWIMTTHASSLTHLLILGFLIWHLTRTKSLFELVKKCWVFGHIEIVVILIIIVRMSFTDLTAGIVSYSFPLSISNLFLKHNHYWLGWLIQKVLEVHCVIRNRFGCNSFVETKVIMTLLESIKGDVSVEFTHGMRFWVHIHFEDFYLK